MEKEWNLDSEHPVWDSRLDISYLYLMIEEGVNNITLVTLSYSVHENKQQMD